MIEIDENSLTRAVQRIIESGRGSALGEAIAEGFIYKLEESGVLSTPRGHDTGCSECSNCDDCAKHDICDECVRLDGWEQDKSGISHGGIKFSIPGDEALHMKAYCGAIFEIAADDDAEHRCCQVCVGIEETKRLPKED
jgi:hypothetical protein